MSALPTFPKRVRGVTSATVRFADASQRAARLSQSSEAPALGYVQSEVYSKRYSRAPGAGQMTFAELTRLSRRKSSRFRRVTLRSVALAVVMLVRCARSIARRKADADDGQPDSSGAHHHAHHHHAHVFDAPREVAAAPRVRFPALAELSGLPAETKAAIRAAAAEVLRGAVAKSALRRALVKRRVARERRAVVPSSRIDAAAAQCEFFLAWPLAAVRELVGRWPVCTTERSEALYYEGEPTTHVTLLADGHATGTEDGRAVRYEAPVFLRGTAPVLGDRGTAAVNVTDRCDVVRIPVEAVRRAFDAARTAELLAYVTARRIERLVRRGGLSPAHVQHAPLFAQLSPEHRAVIGRAAEPASFLEGAVVIPRPSFAVGTALGAQTVAEAGSRRRSSSGPLLHEDLLAASARGAQAGPAAAVTPPLPGEVMVFVVRGHLVGVTRHRDAGGQWADLVFARWGPGESLGDKALYFGSHFHFAVQASADADLYVVRRPVLQRLLEMDKALRQSLVVGAFAIRRSDPAVRMSLNTVRGIPWVRAALHRGAIGDVELRRLFFLFEYRLFPRHDLVTSTSARVEEMIVLMSGTAIADFSGGAPFVLRHGKVLGHHALSPMRWRHATIAVTECEGWVLPVRRAVEFVLECGGPRLLAALRTVCRAHIEEQRGDVKRVAAMLEEPVPPLPADIHRPGSPLMSGASPPRGAASPPRSPQPQPQPQDRDSSPPAVPSAAPVPAAGSPASRPPRTPQLGTGRFRHSVPAELLPPVSCPPLPASLGAPKRRAVSSAARGPTRDERLAAFLKEQLASAEAPRAATPGVGAGRRTLLDPTIAAARRPWAVQRCATPQHALGRCQTPGPGVQRDPRAPVVRPLPVGYFPTSGPPPRSAEGCLGPTGPSLRRQLYDLMQGRRGTGRPPAL